MTYAVSDFVEQRLGRRYLESVPTPLAEIYEETTATTPLFFVLSPGVDPLKARSFVFVCVFLFSVCTICCYRLFVVLTVSVCV